MACLLSIPKKLSGAGCTFFRRRGGQSTLVLNEASSSHGVAQAPPRLQLALAILPPLDFVIS
jgi:hypothetical protein